MTLAQASDPLMKQLPLDFLKIDGEFVRNCRESHTDQLLIQAVVDIAHGLGKQTIAEFVGDEETVRLLARLGGDYGQGFHLGHPRSHRRSAEACPIKSLNTSRPGERLPNPALTGREHELKGYRADQETALTRRGIHPWVRWRVGPGQLLFLPALGWFSRRFDGRGGTRARR